VLILNDLCIVRVAFAGSNPWQISRQIREAEREHRLKPVPPKAKKRQQGCWRYPNRITRLSIDYYTRATPFCQGRGLRSGRARCGGWHRPGDGNWGAFLGEVGKGRRAKTLRMALWIEAVAGTETRLRWRVNFGGGWSVFTGKDISTVMKTKGLGVAWGVQSYSQWGRRAEDPFRGLRAGPVRYSPLFLVASRELAILPDVH